MHPPSCPVILQANTVLQNSTTLRTSIQQLRRDMRKCADCDQAGDCAFMRQLDSLIDAALQSITAEWGLV